MRLTGVCACALGLTVHAHNLNLPLRHKPRTDGISQWQWCRESMYMYIASLCMDWIRGVWNETPPGDVIADIHSLLVSQMRAALGKFKCGLHLAGIGVGCTGPELVRTAPGSELLWTALGQNWYEKYRGQNWCGLHQAGAVGRCPRNCSHSGGGALISYQTFLLLIMGYGRV